MSYYIGLSLLSNKERAYKKAASAEARRILSMFVERPIEEKDIEREGQGRPFLPDRELDFSISHSGALAAVSLVRGGNLRTGCDVELVRGRPGAPEIAEKFFSASEKNYIFPERGPMYSRASLDEARFYRIWTLKECYLKLRGLSVFDMASVPSFINDEGSFAFCAAVSSAISFRLYELSGRTPGGEHYMLATAIELTGTEEPEIQWFSQSVLDCKIMAEIKAAPNPAQTVSPKR